MKLILIGFFMFALTIQCLNVALLLRDAYLVLKGRKTWDD